MQMREDELATRDLDVHGRMAKFAFRSACWFGITILAVLVGAEGSKAQSTVAGCLLVDGFESGDLCAWLGLCPAVGPLPGAAAQIEAARLSPDGFVSLPIDGALVTYVASAVGTEPDGFFVQGDTFGPALFVAVDPAGLTPIPSTGDIASFTITDMGTSFELRQALDIADWSVLASGAHLECFRQDVTAATDLVSDIANYDSEFIGLRGVVAGSFEPAGLDWESAPLETSGIVGDPNLQLRVPSVLRDQIDVVDECMLDLTGTPLWRFGSVVQPSAWVEADLDLKVCPAPQVLSATATGCNTVEIAFDRRLEPSSVLPGGSQFSFDNGLVATAATAIDRLATVSTTENSTGVSYEVTVAASVLDRLGEGVDSLANQASFDGQCDLPQAVVLINEVKCHGSSGPEDYIELHVVGGVLMGSWTIEEWATGSTPAVEWTFDPGFVVTTGDLIVMHYDAANQGAFSQEDDAGSTLDESEGTDAVDTAWDVYSSLTSCSSTDNFLLLRDDSGVVVDSVAYTNGDGTITTTMEGIFAAVFADSTLLWQFSTAADGSNDATIQGEAAFSGNSDGLSAQRDSDYPPGGIQDTNSNAEWCAAGNSMGTVNIDCP